MTTLRFFFACSALTFSSMGCAIETETERGSGTESQSQELGVEGPAFYAEGELYRTVATPTSLGENQPAHSTDVIYDLGGVQLNVADGAPGVPGYNGGRWEVHAVSFADYEMALAAHDANASGSFDFASEIEAALAAGDAMDEGIVKRFECPAIKLPKNQR